MRAARPPVRLWQVALHAGARRDAGAQHLPASLHTSHYFACNPALHAQVRGVLEQHLRASGAEAASAVLQCLDESEFYLWHQRHC